MNEELTPDQLMTKRLVDAIELLTKQAGRDNAAIRGLMDRVERLENVLGSYARVKGDGELIDRIGRTESAKVSHPDRVPPAWPEPLPYPSPDRSE